MEEALYLANVPARHHWCHRRDKFGSRKILADKLMARVASKITWR